MESPKLGKETGTKHGMLHRMFKVLRMHGGVSSFTSGREDSGNEPTCTLGSPDYWKETKIATLDADLKKAEAEMEWRRRSQFLR
jgi:hypothetical protein